MADLKTYLEDLILKDKADIKALQEKIDTKAGPLLAQKSVIETALKTKQDLIRGYEKASKPVK